MAVALGKAMVTLLMLPAEVSTWVLFCKEIYPKKPTASADPPTFHAPGTVRETKFPFVSVKVGAKRLLVDSHSKNTPPKPLFVLLVSTKLPTIFCKPLVEKNKFVVIVCVLVSVKVGFCEKSLT